jgi:hypothetical protein
LLLLLQHSPVQAQAQQSDARPFAKMFAWTRSLVLDETPDAVNASPAFTHDSAGSLIVWDLMAPQVRLYDGAGKLRSFFGREGRGPGEFRRLAGAFRVSSGNLVTVSAEGRVTVWSPAGDRRVNDFETRLPTITAASAWRGDTILVTTWPRFNDPSQLNVPVLHVVDVASGRVVNRLLEPHVVPGTVAAWATILMGSVISTPQAAYVTLPLADTVFVLRSLRADAVRRIPLRAEILAANGTPPDGHADRGAFFRWVQQATFPASIHGDEAAGFCVLLLRPGDEPNRGLLYISPGFGTTTYVADAPAVLGFDPVTREFLFDDPSTLEPNRVRYARRITPGD